jgi:hypothetical protein
MLQGLTTAHSMTGDLKRYQGATRITDSAFFGLQFQAGGVPFGDAADDHVLNEKCEDLSVSAFLGERGRVIGYFACSKTEISRSFKQALFGIIPYTF